MTVLVVIGSAGGGVGERYAANGARVPGGGGGLGSLSIAVSKGSSSFGVSNAGPGGSGSLFTTVGEKVSGAVAGVRGSCSSSSGAGVGSASGTLNVVHGSGERGLAKGSAKGLSSGLLLNAIEDILEGGGS